MKKTASVLILIVFALVFSLGMLNFSVPSVARAQENLYIQIPDKAPTADLTNASISTVPFRSADGFTELFYLPTTYYLKVLKVTSASVELFGGGIYDVEYNGLTGKIILTDLKTVYETLPTPSANATVDTVGEAPKSHNSQNIALMKYKAESPTVVAGASVDDSWTISYMGETLDTTKYYVKCEKDSKPTVYGAIAKDNFESFSIPLHQVVINAQEELKAKDNEPDGTGGSAKPQNDALIKSILIIGIIIPAVLIVILLFKPRKRANNYDYQSRRMSGPSRYDYGRDRRYDDDRYQDDYRRYDSRPRPRDDYYEPRNFRDEDR